MKNIYCPIILFLSFLVTINASAQDSLKTAHQLTFSGYTDTYFAGYSTQSSTHDFQDFIAVGPRDNSFGVNIAQFGLSYEHQYVRSNITIHMGDIALATWSDEYPYLQQANVGIRLAESLWLDAGFFHTHLGAESFLPKNNMLSSLAFLTYNEPFFQSGAKLSWDASEKFYAELWVLNGYHSHVDNNESKSVGVLLSYAASDNTSITYTNLYGRENEEGINPTQVRFYQNVYFNQNWNDKVMLSAGFDVGVQTNSDIIDNTQGALMYGGIITTRYQFNPKWSVTGRGEIFNDKNGFISGTMDDVNGNPTGLELVAFTLGTEYSPMEKAYLRFEGRYTSAPEDLKIFPEDTPSNSRLEFLVTMGFEIDKIFKF